MKCILFLQKIFNFLIPKRAGSVYAVPHYNTAADAVDLENFTASNLLCFLRYLLDNKERSHRFWLVCYHSERIEALSARFGDAVVFLPSHREGGISRREKLKRWLREFVLSCRCEELWCETGGSFRHKARRQRVVCFNYFIPFKNDYFTDNRWWRDVDYLLATSKLTAQILSLSTGVAYHRIHPLGFPRCREMLDNTRGISREQLDAILGTAGKRLVIYAPTYRPEAKGERQMFGYDEEGAIEAVLEAAGAVVVLKMHPLDCSRIPSARGVRLEPNSAISIYDVMKFADLLISDYSSIGYDFALLGKPVLLNWYDGEDYLRTRGVSYEPMHLFAPGAILSNAEGLAEAIRAALSGETMPPDLDWVCLPETRMTTNEALYCDFMAGWPPIPMENKEK